MYSLLFHLSISNLVILQMELKFVHFLDLGPLPLAPVYFASSNWEERVLDQIRLGTRGSDGNAYRSFAFVIILLPPHKSFLFWLFLKCLMFDPSGLQFPRNAGWILRPWVLIVGKIRWLVLFVFNISYNRIQSRDIYFETSQL